ncbi:MAG TPA: HAD-IA family hydrolase [Xanthomonadales bacterium]|nr:HAD-IA family hydrolase [Xanthomonadales bacterium]
MTAIRAMLFDLDGTLLDSAPDLVAALNWVRRSEKLPPLPVADMQRFASKGAVGLLKAGMPPTDGELFESWRQRFLAHYAENSYRKSALYDGVPELLAFLGEMDMPWGIVTNKTEWLTFPIVEAAKLSKTISCVVCGDTLSESKPHPAPVTLACAMVDVTPAEVLFVGDDVRDIQAGRAAGTQTAAAFYGYGSHEMDDDFVAGSFRVHHPAELIELVRKQNDLGGPG